MKRRHELIAVVCLIVSGLASQASAQDNDPAPVRPAASPYTYQGSIRDARQENRAVETTQPKVPLVRDARQDRQTAPNFTIASLFSGRLDRPTMFQDTADPQGAPQPDAEAPAEGSEGGEGGQGQGDLASKFTSPTALLTSYQFVTQYNPIVAGTNSSSVQFLFRPVMPIPKNDLIPLPQILRITAPVASSFDSPGGFVPGGFGDVQVFDLFIMPLGEKLTFGVGPVAIFPTATTKFTGQGWYQVGAAFVTLFTGIPKWQLGILVQELISVGVEPRPPVHQMIYQLILTRHFQKGWYMGFCGQPAVIDWRSGHAQFPAGVALGRVFTVWKQPVNFSVLPTYYVGATDLQTRLQVQFNFSMIYGK